VIRLDGTRRVGVTRPRLAKGNGPAALVDAIGSDQPFYLPYQGRNDRELQSLYGAAVCSALGARFATPVLPPPPAAQEPIRHRIQSGSGLEATSHPQMNSRHGCCGRSS
jgi:hypothetical protein